MPAVCRIVADDREPAEGVPRALAARGVRVTIARLWCGDYALPNNVVVERKTVYGLHASMVEGPVLAAVWSTNPSQSAEWLHRLALRASGLQPIRDRPAYAHRPKPEHNRVPEAMLAAVPGISTKRARALLESFGSVAGIAAADREDWLKVPGIGAIQAVRLRKAFS